MSTDSANNFIGLMSGTSMDGVDCVIANFASGQLQLVATHSEPIPDLIKHQALQVSLGKGSEPFTDIATLDVQFGHLFARSVNHLLQKANLQPSQIAAIGSHGQTIWHQPRGPNPFSLQIGDPNIIAKSTGITTIADFRRADIALGGQGAPFVPPFHQWLFAADNPRVVLNIGGIANITVLPANNQACLGFDTGPGNGLMDAWIAECREQPYDKDGVWAQQGKLLPELLERLLQDPFFSQTGPKSTGKDYFNLRWLQQYLQNEQSEPADVQATLLALTSISISRAIQKILPKAEILLCGGGSHNMALVDSLANTLGKDYQICTTKQYGLPPDWVEAACFAWLAKMCLTKTPIDLTAITGASRPTILGGIYSS